MSDDSDIEPRQHRKRKIRYIDETSSSDSSIEVRKRTKSHNKNHICDTESDSDSSIEEICRRRKKRIGRVPSDSTDQSDGGFEGSSSEWETEVSDSEMKKTERKCEKTQDAVASSDSGDEQTEKCPICLVSFKNQEVGVPESCDHAFCADCIQEWSKNVNTCPVDRQSFNLILIRDGLKGKFLRQIQVEIQQQQQNDFEIIEEDPTYCEICGFCDNEDRMLLCDGCDLGFHLECLRPPLHEVPVGAWYCNNCLPDHVQRWFLQISRTGGLDGSRRRPTSPRLVPRTRQSERVRQRIARHRNANQTVQNNAEERASASSGVEDSTQAGPSTSNLSASSTNRRQRTTTRRKRKAKRRKRKYRLVYKIDETTGETVAVKQFIKKRKRNKRSVRRNRARARIAAQPTTVKERLARQLGICRPQTATQHVPDVKIQTNSNTIGAQRYQAGIPVLHLFGQHDELDYFSESDTEIGNSDVLIRRRPNLSDMIALRRRTRQKGIAINSPVVTSSNDLLSSILDSQEKLHSKNTVLSINPDGTLKVDPKQLPLKNDKDDYINLNNNLVKSKQAPMYPANTSNTNNRSSNAINRSQGNIRNNYSNYNFLPTSTVGASNAGSSFHNDEFEGPHDYSQAGLYRMYDPKIKDGEKRNDEEDKIDTSASDDNTPRSAENPNSDSELDIYSDIESISASRFEESDAKPPYQQHSGQVTNPGSDDENDSDAELIIDTENTDAEKHESPTFSAENTKEETVSSTVDPVYEPCGSTLSAAVHSNSEIQSEAIQSTSQNKSDSLENDEDDDSEDGCPNFSIYSAESINLAKTTDLELLSESSQNVDYANSTVGCSEVSSTPAELKAEDEAIPEEQEADKNDDLQNTDVENLQNDGVENPQNGIKKGVEKKSSSGGLYSDSEDENIKIDLPKQFGISDLRNITEDISEEERSYTPCLDERVTNRREGLEGLDTEMISDEDRNDFDETHELKTVSDGDALEINAKESELDFSKAEDYEEGEIVDKNKLKTSEPKEQPKDEKEINDEDNKKEEEANKTDDKNKDKENENQIKDSAFKKLSKNNKERNYRDKEGGRSKSKEKRGKSDKENKKEKRRDKRKEIERYDVRALIETKPRRLKDKFGRDIKRSESRSSRSLTPPRKSPIRNRRSPARDNKSKKRRERSKNRRSYSRSKSPGRRHSRNRNKKRRRSSSNDGRKRRKSRNRSRGKERKARSISRNRSRSPSPRRGCDWPERRLSREKNWTPSPTLSECRDLPRNPSPSWTPPRMVEPKTVKPHNLTVILTNDSSKKKKEKKKKPDKKSKDSAEKRRRKRIDRTPPPSKEVFASGDNILVSVSFNKDNESRDVTTTKRKRDIPGKELTVKKIRRERRLRNRKNNKDLSGIKPVAIIDLERSPFKEITPSPKNVIVLSDSDNGEGNDLLGLQKALCDSSQQAASPECTNNYSTGPKTPPEPQVKFLLAAKPPQMRAISNPLHDPAEVEVEVDPQEELEQRLNEVVHKGPNTPPEPPNSPPSSPDAYDPFDPTKSRSPTPEPLQTATQSNSQSVGDNRDDSMSDRAGDMIEKSNSPISKSPDILKSHTPPVTDTQPDSQSSIVIVTTPDTRDSPERSIGVIINQVVQPQSTGFPSGSSKPVAPAIPYPSSSQSLITSTPISANLAVSRINILNSTILTPPMHVVSSLPQRAIPPNTTKSPVKAAQTKLPIKSTPIKPMPSKNILSKSNKSARKSNNRSQNGSDEIVNLDFDSPYSPGSSDYEDLFEPPPETSLKATSSAKMQQKITKPTPKVQNAFDALFGSSPSYKNKNKSNDKNKYPRKNPFTPSKGTKQVGVKLDEDNLRILEELPNSAVEMQVKDKFLKKLNRQERVVEEVKLVLKPHYNKKRINKEEYKDILRRAVPKICHNRSGEINPNKIKNLIEAYVKKIRHSKKVTSSSSVNPQKA